ncbi:hypothetical protein CARUB_v10020647mg [Capsella rubella]|uniref:Interactor of constitutive active ROPs 4 n=1 Tax=Capsella rubella TaxID=81985 RepID=R0HZX6_9BRAS|nr:interactor of constitutive active ROPs 4 [Capsella rubella]XP_023643605.1 interactor of constitutive active ROPs 4 [Capsella rubella]XP_023643606.1 interactor of constitutive active ROPs 4 [Capsella rubella]XP_023643607.1 interactor of constitutive active ROPs 4 [Capsella rubella]XP_023643608.1 interactor of constitutive active ROPs 4 [Capsella rubella]EOA35444.1 hypothetical protein CARUB_v10020647mg [Capsella rubella]
MPKPSIRGSELSQRQSPRLRTSSSSTASDPHHLSRPTQDQSLKLGLDRRYSRSGGPHTDPLTQKKLGSRISGLESQLGQAQEELRLLKQQLAKAEAAKKRAQEELHKKKPKKPNPPVPERDNIPGDRHQETDVFEVPVEKTKEGEKLKTDELASKEDQINVLKARLYDLEKEKLSLNEENEGLKNQLKKMDSEMSTAKAKEGGIASKVSQIEEELQESNETMAKLKKKLESMEEAKESLEAEMKKLRVQTEQWRKAADAAAAVLSGGVEMNGRFSERCGSMETHFAGRFVGSPGMADDSDDGLGSGKRKGSGMKMFGDLWKKKGQK